MSEKDWLVLGIVAAVGIVLLFIGAIDRDTRRTR